MTEFNFGNHPHQFPTGDFLHNFVERIEARLEAMGIQFGDVGALGLPALEHPGALHETIVADTLLPLHSSPDHHLFG